MILIVSVKIFVAMPVFVRQMGNPVLKLAILHKLIEFVRMSSQSTEDIIE